MCNYIATRSPKQVEQMVGRALVHLFNRQTEDEKSCNDTRKHNMMGFTPADASISAKTFLKRKALLDWQVERWVKPNVKGIPRIAKYHAQLNAVAMVKAAHGVKQ
jgi:hypothetical protein